MSLSSILDPLLAYPWLCVVLAFILGSAIGSFLNVCIARLPLQKSVLWPGSRCGTCFQPIRWSDNLPLISYWRLKGRCRTCGTTFSQRYFWIELLTGVAFAGLFWLEVVENFPNVGQRVGMLPFSIQAAGIQPADLVVVWLGHALLLCLLIVATFTDIDYQEIPLGVTIPGTVLGILIGTLAPWPWPLQLQSGENPGLWHFLPAGLQPWPFYLFGPGWLEPGSWLLGLTTSVVGAVVGTGLMRLIRLVFTWGLGKEAMGLGDADLMMMIGAFLGWQSLFFVLIFAVLLGLLYAVSLIVRNKGNELPFGPFLAGGAVLTMVCFWYLGASFQWFFFDYPLIVALLVLSGVLAFIMTLAIRMIRLIFETA